MDLCDDPAGDNYQYYIDAKVGFKIGIKITMVPKVIHQLKWVAQRVQQQFLTQRMQIKDNTMNTIDSYFQYSMPITKNHECGNHPFISDIRNDVKVDLPNGQTITTQMDSI